MTTKTKMEQQLDLIESLVTDLRKSYGLDKQSEEQPKVDADGHKIGADGIYESLDRSFKDVVKIIKSDHELCSGANSYRERGLR